MEIGAQGGYITSHLSYENFMNPEFRQRSPFEWVLGNVRQIADAHYDAIL